MNCKIGVVSYIFKILQSSKDSRKYKNIFFVSFYRLKLKYKFRKKLQLNVKITLMIDFKNYKSYKYSFYLHRE